jgi:hypothetical protein
MIPCLCFIATVLIVLLIRDFENENEIIYANQLRGLQNERKNDIMTQAADILIKHIYYEVMNTATKGITTYHFNILCKSSTIDNDDCKKYNGYKKWEENNEGQQLVSIMKEYNIQPNILRSQILAKLKNTFPDSNITTTNKNCCKHYVISW